MANVKCESGKAMQNVGMPSSSFLTRHAFSMLFDSESTTFEEALPLDLQDDKMTKVFFCDIRARYQTFGKLIVNKASDWLQEAQVGQLKLMEQKVEELG